MMNEFLPEPVDLLDRMLLFERPRPGRLPGMGAYLQEPNIIARCSVVPSASPWTHGLSIPESLPES